jgi:S-adenosylmethionine:tRNA ribosyltransferase-isomerase
MSGSGYQTSDFDYHLPPEQIAQTPAARRDRSRLLVVDRASGALAHRVFSDLPEYLSPGDALVVNETRVFPARLLGRRASGAPGEVLLLTPEAGEEKLWRALVRPGRKLKPGRTVEVAPDLSVEIVDSTPGGERIVRVHTPLPLAEALDRYGEVPLPPYVERAATAEDRERYQTVYARERGSVAAPTAGLHFTPELLAALEAKGRADRAAGAARGRRHLPPGGDGGPGRAPMHAEWYHVSAEAAEALNAVRAAGGAICAVGTTVVRTLETVATDGRRDSPRRGVDGHLHPPAVPVPGGGPPGDQLPPAPLDAADAGLGLRRSRPDDAGVPRGGGRRVPLLLVRRYAAEIAAGGFSG